MKKLILPLALCFVLAVSIFSSAQQPSSLDAPDKADIMKLLNAMHAREDIEQDNAAEQKEMRQGLEMSFKKKAPNATPAQMAEVDQLFDSTFKPPSVDEKMDALVAIYQKNFTKEDIAVLTSFYRSPTGQKLVQEMPQIAAESAQAGAQLRRREFAAHAKEFKEKMDAIVQAANKQ